MPNMFEHFRVGVYKTISQRYELASKMPNSIESIFVQEDLKLKDKETK